MAIEYDEIADSVRLDEVLTELGVVVTHVTRGEHWASCPLPSHPGADARPSFSINEMSLLWNCFTCGEGGPLPLLVMKIEETDWDSALEFILPYSDGEVSDDDDAGFRKQLEAAVERAQSPPKRTRREPLPFYSPKVIERLREAPVALLEKWNITAPETVEHFQIKYDEEHTRVSTKGTYTGPALVIPHFFGGELVGYQERWLDEDRGKYPPKYTNSDDFPKRQTLYGFDDAVEAARRGTPVIVVESVMTCARLWELGYTAVATFGASVTDEQTKLLRSLFAGVILSPDADAAGKKATNKLANALTDFIPVYLLPPAPVEKGDLADIDEEEVHLLINHRQPVFSVISER